MSERDIFFGALGILAGVVGGYSIATMQPHAHDTAVAIGHSDSTHMHEQVEVVGTVPTLSVEVLPDAADGYNVHIRTAQFTFVPELVNTAVVQNEGHAHIYVNGEKLARVYGEWFHVSSAHLQEGENMIRVTLNAHDHAEWTVEGMSIAQEITILK